jgi:hypothetical protein
MIQADEAETRENIVGLAAELAAQELKASGRQLADEEITPVVAREVVRILREIADDVEHDVFGEERKT